MYACQRLASLSIKGSQLRAPVEPLGHDFNFYLNIGEFKLRINPTIATPAWRIISLASIKEMILCSPVDRGVEGRRWVSLITQRDSSFSGS